MPLNQKISYIGTNTKFLLPKDGAYQLFIPLANPDSQLQLSCSESTITLSPLQWDTNGVYVDITVPNTVANGTYDIIVKTGAYTNQQLPTIGDIDGIGKIEVLDSTALLQVNDQVKKIIASERPPTNTFDLTQIWLCTIDGVKYEYNTGTSEWFSMHDVVITANDNGATANNTLLRFGNTLYANDEGFPIASRSRLYEFDFTNSLQAEAAFFAFLENGALLDNIDIPPVQYGTIELNERTDTPSPIYINEGSGLNVRYFGNSSTRDTIVNMRWKKVYEQFAFRQTTGLSVAVDEYIIYAEFSGVEASIFDEVEMRFIAPPINVVTNPLSLTKNGKNVWSETQIFDSDPSGTTFNVEIDFLRNSEVLHTVTTTLVLP